MYKYHMRDIQSTSNDRDCSIYFHFFEFSSSMGIHDLSASACSPHLETFAHTSILHEFDASNNAQIQLYS